MKRGLFFWGAFILVAVIIAGGFFYIGRKPSLLDPLNAIPEVEADQSWLLLESPGDQLSLLEWPEDKNEVSTVEVFTKDILGLSSLSSKVALWVQLPYGDRWYGAFQIPKEEIDSLRALKTPERWRSRFPNCVVGETSEGAIKIKFSEDSEPVVGAVERGTLLLSKDAHGLSKMYEAIETPSKRMKVKWDVKPSLPAHLVVFDDGKLASKLGEKLGVDEDLGKSLPLTFTLGWESSDDRGNIFWNINGLEDVFASNDVAGLIEPISWEGEFFVPDPLVAAFAFNAKGLVADTMREGFEEAASKAYSERKELLELLDGVIISMVGGKSRVALLSLPGILVQLPERGDKGVEAVNELWDSFWLDPRPIEGFAAGGAVAFPFTLIGAADERLVLLGAIDLNTLIKNKSVTEIIGYDKPSLGWLYVDFPKAAEALEDLQKINSLSTKVGVTNTPDLEKIEQTISRLKQLGRLKMVFYDLKSGEARWEPSN